MSGRRSSSARSPPGLLYAVNKSYADADSAVADGDEVALIPPVSGGAFRLTAGPLSLDAAVRRSPTRPGRSRRSSAHVRTGRAAATVVHLDYEAYEGMAEQVMARDRRRARAKYELLASRSTTGPAGSGSASRAW